MDAGGRRFWSRVKVLKYHLGKDVWFSRSLRYLKKKNPHKPSLKLNVSESSDYVFLFTRLLIRISYSFLTQFTYVVQFKENSVNALMTKDLRSLGWTKVLSISTGVLKIHIKIGILFKDSYCNSIRCAQYFLTSWPLRNENVSSGQIGFSCFLLLCDPGW